MGLNKEVAKKWVEALRSGEYKQAQGALHRADGYCCLGVLCDLYRIEHPEAEWAYGEYEFVAKYGVFEFDEDGYHIIPEWAAVDGEPPGIVQRWAGIGDPIIGDCIHLNDSDKAPFTEIASYIEKEAGIAEAPTS